MQRFKTIFPGFTIVWAERLLVIAGICCVFPGCFQHFYRTKTQMSVPADLVDSLARAGKFFVVHGPHNNSYAFEQILVEGSSLRGTPVTLPETRSKHLNPDPSRANQVAKSDKRTTLNEVHLYTQQTFRDTGEVSISIDSIQRIDVYTFDQKRTNASSIISSFVLAAVVTLFIVGASVGASGIP